MIAIMLHIPMVTYEILSEACDPSLPEYELLKNGLVMRNQQGNQEVQVLTDKAGAKQIMEFAATACPQVIPFIKVISEPVKQRSDPTPDKVVTDAPPETHLLMVRSSTEANR